MLQHSTCSITCPTTLHFISPVTSSPISPYLSITSPSPHAYILFPSLSISLVSLISLLSYLVSHILLLSYLTSLLSCFSLISLLSYLASLLSHFPLTSCPYLTFFPRTYLSPSGLCTYIPPSSSGTLGPCSYLCTYKYSSCTIVDL